MQSIGVIEAIYRYPVKSFQGERLSTVDIERYGLYGDRGYAFIDHTRSTDASRSNKKLNAKFVPKLLAYSSKYAADRSGNEFPPVQVTAPDGRVFQWDEELYEEIRAVVSPREISPQKYSPEHDDLLGVDEANILLATDVSLAELEKIIGVETDMRRFRPNFVIRYDEQRPFEEFDWIGKTVHIGDTKLEVYKKCHRCSMVNVDPDHNTVNPTFLKHIAKHLDACFGVYARVVRTGTITVDDPVYLSD